MRFDSWRYSVYKHADSWFVETPNGYTYGPYFNYEVAAQRCRLMTDARRAASGWHTVMSGTVHGIPG